MKNRYLEKHRRLITLLTKHLENCRRRGVSAIYLERLEQRIALHRYAAHVPT